MYYKIFQDIATSKESLIWYKKLNIHQKITLKEIFDELCGVPWSELSEIFTLRELIGVLYNKLILEGIIVEGKCDRQYGKKL